MEAKAERLHQQHPHIPSWNFWQALGAQGLDRRVLWHDLGVTDQDLAESEPKRIKVPDSQRTLDGGFVSDRTVKQNLETLNDALVPLSLLVTTGEVSVEYKTLTGNVIKGVGDWEQARRDDACAKLAEIKAFLEGKSDAIDED